MNQIVAVEVKLVKIDTYCWGGHVCCYLTLINSCQESNATNL